MNITYYDIRYMSLKGILLPGSSPPDSPCPHFLINWPFLRSGTAVIFEGGFDQNLCKMPDWLVNKCSDNTFTVHGEKSKHGSRCKELQCYDSKQNLAVSSVPEKFTATVN